MEEGRKGKEWQVVERERGGRARQVGERARGREGGRVGEKEKQAVYRCENQGMGRGRKVRLC